MSNSAFAKANLTGRPARAAVVVAARFAAGKGHAFEQRQRAKFLIFAHDPCGASRRRRPKATTLLKPVSALVVFVRFSGNGR